MRTRLRHLSLYICDDLGVPVEPLKTFHPTTCLLYLGFLSDTLKLELRLPEEKQQKALRALSIWDNKRWGRKCELLSLIGLLQQCTQAIPIGRSFLRRLIDHAHLKELHHFVMLSIWERDDIEWWHRLILNWNGKRLFLFPKWEVGPDFSVTSDAAGSVGFGAYLGKEWLQKHGPSTENIDISIKEMLPIVMAADIWGESWERCCVLFRTDNQAVFATLKSGLCHNHLLAFVFMS